MGVFGLNTPSPRQNGKHPSVSPVLPGAPGEVALPEAPQQQLERSGPDGSNGNAPSRANRLKLHGTGPQTADGQDLQDRVVPEIMTNALAGPMNLKGRMGNDASLKRYSDVIAAQYYFSARMCDPVNTILNALLSMWTTRNWTYSINAAGDYVRAFAKYLGLTFVGRPFGTGNRVPGFASGNAALESDKSSSETSGFKPE